MVQDHHDFPSDEGADDHNGDGRDLDLVLGKEKLLERQDYAEAEQEIDGDQADFL
jgi:hypothetical protein